MAKRVVRMTSVYRLEQETSSGGVVVLKAEGLAGGQETRVEINLDSYDAVNFVEKIRAGVKAHVDKWTAAQRAVGTE